MSDKPKPVLWAFWKYTSYPFALGAEIEMIGCNGIVFPKGYGNNGFRPFLVVLAPDGKKIKESLDSLKHSYEEALADLKDEYESKRLELWRRFDQGTNSNV